MFYKVLHNNMLIDLLTDVRYVRYLPRQKRLVQTDSQSANGVMGSDRNTVYHLIGRPNTFDTAVKSVEIHKISEEEFDRLSMEFSIAREENASLHAEVKLLRQQLSNQSIMLDMILAKLG